MTAQDLTSELASMVRDARKFAFKIPKNHYDRICWLLFVCSWGGFFSFVPLVFLVHAING